MSETVAKFIGGLIGLAIAGAIYAAIAYGLFWVGREVYRSYFPKAFVPPKPLPELELDWYEKQLRRNMPVGIFSFLKVYVECCISTVKYNYFPPPIPRNEYEAKEYPKQVKEYEAKLDYAEWELRFIEAAGVLIDGRTKLVGKNDYGEYTMPFSHAHSPSSVRRMLQILTRDHPYLKTPLFPYLKNEYQRRLEYCDEALKKKTITTDEHHVRNLLYKTSFEDLIETSMPMYFPQEPRFEGTWVIAPPGRGKTTMLSKLIYDDISRVRDGLGSIIVMDSKGDLLDHLRRYVSFSPEHKLHGKLILIEPSANLALNPLDLGASAGHNIELLEYVFSALLDSKTTPLQSTLFRSVLIAMRGIPNATFQTFTGFLREGWKPYEQYVRALHPDDAAFFTQGEYDSKTYTETKQQLLWRIRDLTTRVPLLREMFKSPKTQIDIGALMDGGHVILIDNSKALLGDDGSEFFARFFVAMVLGAAQQRSKKRDEDKLPVYFYIDEAQTVIAKDEKIAKILHECRSQKIAMTFAHQELTQIKSDDVKQALANCAYRFTNPDKDAKALADDFRTTTEFLQNLPKGEFALYIRDYTPTATSFQFPNHPVSKWGKMSDAQLEDIRADMKRRFSYDPPHIEPPTATEEPPRPSERPMERQVEDDDSPKLWGKPSLENLAPTRPELIAACGPDGFTDPYLYLKLRDDAGPYWRERFDAENGHLVNPASRKMLGL